MRLLTDAKSNFKTAKNASQGNYLSYILHLAPSKLSGVNVCPKASAGCIATCLNTAGRGVFSNVQAARIRKTRYLFTDRKGFMQDLCKDLDAVCRKALKLKMKPVVRLNGTSDIDWTRITCFDGYTVFERYPEIQFYDYTKVVSRLNVKLPQNYHLTFSRSEVNNGDCLQARGNGFNVAVVFDSIPEFWHGLPVVNGDNHDLRFLDPKGSIVSKGHIIGLKAKGKAKRDTSGFVVRIGA